MNIRILFSCLFFMLIATPKQNAITADFKSLSANSLDLSGGLNRDIVKIGQFSDSVKRINTPESKGLKETLLETAHVVRNNNLTSTLTSRFGSVEELHEVMNKDNEYDNTGSIIKEETTHRQKIEQAANLDNVVFVFDPGEVLVHSDDKRYYRNVTGKIYSLVEKYDIGTWWKKIIMKTHIVEKLNEIESTEKMFKGNSLTEDFIDFIYSTAAYDRPTKLVHDDWPKFIQQLQDSGNRVIIVSTMHPYYGDARERMLRSVGINIDATQILQGPDKGKQLKQKFQLDENVHIIAVDDDPVKLEQYKKEFPHCSLIEYTEGISKKSPFIDELTAKLKQQKPDITQAEIDQEFMKEMEVFWEPIVKKAVENYLDYLSKQTENTCASKENEDSFSASKSINNNIELAKELQKKTSWSGL